MTFRAAGSEKSKGGNSEILNAIAQAKKAKPQVSEYTYAEKDVILYSETPSPV
jgi:hypothetical protein